MSRVKGITKLEKAGEERQAVTGMIIDIQFLRQIRPITKLEYFKAPFAKTVAQWCLDYWDQYEEAPGRQIEELYHAKERAGELDEDQVDIIGQFLESLSEEYERGEKRSTEYVARTTETYFRRRALEILKEDINNHLANRDVEQAELALAQYRTPARENGQHINPFTNEEAIQEAFTQSNEPLFRLPGALGEALNDLFVRDGFLAIMAPEKRGKCISGDTPILLADGSYKLIADVVRDKDARVMALDESTMKFIPMPIADHWANGMKPCVKITTRTGRTITTTLNHPYLTPFGWREVEKLQSGDRIAVPRNLPCFGNEDTPKEKLTLLALLLAEGGLTGNSCPTFTSSHLEIQEEFFRCIAYMGDRAVAAKSAPINFCITNSLADRYKNNRCSTTNWLRELGLVRKKSKDKFIPDFVFRLKKKSLSLFLNILFSCDGSVFPGGIEYSTASEKMARQIHHLLLRFGVVSKITSSFVKEIEYWRLSIGDKDNMLQYHSEIGFSFYKKARVEEQIACLNKKTRANCFLDSVCSDVCKKIKSSLSERLSEDLQEYLRAACQNKLNLSRNVIKRIADVSGNEEARKTAYGDVLWDSIKSIEDVGMVETYDLSVPDHHNFVAGDFVAHNTWMLMYLHKRAAMSRLNTAYFAVGDMTKPQMTVRYHIMHTHRSHRKKYCGDILIPVVDCVRNQDGSCDLAEREGEGDLVKTAGRDSKHTVFQEYKERPDWVPCAYCARDRVLKNKFVGACWHRERKAVEPLDWRDAVKAGKEFADKVMRERQFYLDCYPNSSINVQGIDNALALWEAKDGFVPDVILIDYADILAPEDGKKDFRHQQNETWKALRKLSQTRNCLVITATQADAASYSQKMINESNFSEDKRKYSHVTGVITLNQEAAEKKKGVMRIGTMFLREDDFDTTRAVTVLQSLATGQPVLGSYF